jgi:hypothetical protein
LIYFYIWNGGSTGIRYLSKTRWVRTRVLVFTHGYETLPATYVLAGRYLFYLIRTRLVAIPSGGASDVVEEKPGHGGERRRSGAEKQGGRGGGRARRSRGAAMVAGNWTTHDRYQGMARWLAAEGSRGCTRDGG